MMITGRVILFYVTFIFPQLDLAGQISESDSDLVNQVYSNWKNENARMGYLCDTFYYLDKPKTGILDAIKKAIIESGVWVKRIYTNSLQFSFDKDSITLSNDEKNGILNKLDSFMIKGLENKLFPNSKMEHNYQVSSLLEQVNKSKDSLQKKLCHTYYSFIPPIFLRQGSFCIFYSEEASTLMESADCWLYQKTQKGWIKFAPIFRWFK